MSSSSSVTPPEVEEVCDATAAYESVLLRRTETLSALGYLAQVEAFVSAIGGNGKIVVGSESVVI